MIRHWIILGAFVTLLVGLMLYFMSPGEVMTACAGARRKVSDAAEEMLVALHWRALPIEVQAPVKRAAARNLMPDPFHPYGPQPANARGSDWTWLRTREMLWLPAVVAAVLWWLRRARRKRFQFAVEQKMASTLSKAVRRWPIREGL